MIVMARLLVLKDEKFEEEAIGIAELLLPRAEEEERDMVNFKGFCRYPDGSRAHYFTVEHRDGSARECIEWVAAHERVVSRREKEAVNFASRLYPGKGN